MKMHGFQIFHTFKPRTSFNQLKCIGTAIIIMLNAVISRIICYFKMLKIYLDFVCLPASLQLDPVALCAQLQKFHTIEVLATYLQDCCSDY